MTIKQFYLSAHPTDAEVKFLNDDATFSGLLNVLYTKRDVYKYIGHSDSIIRERLFKELSNQIGSTYDYIYNLWMQAE